MGLGAERNTASGRESPRREEDYFLAVLDGELREQFRKLPLWLQIQLRREFVGNELSEAAIAYLKVKITMPPGPGPFRDQENWPRDQTPIIPRGQSEPL